MFKNKNLLDLPVLLHDRDMACGTSEITDSYVEELGKTEGTEALAIFIERWENVWMLAPAEGPEELSLEEEKLLELDFSLTRVLQLLLRKKEDGLDSDDIEVRIMANLAAPVPFIRAALFSNYWGVGTDLGLIRMYLDPYKYLDECCRYGSGDLRFFMVKEVMEW